MNAECVLGVYVVRRMVDSSLIGGGMEGRI